MKNLTKKFSIFVFFVLSCSFIFSGFAFAQRPLEVPLPAVGGESQITTTPFLPSYIKYVFNFAIGIGGFIVFCVLIYGGLCHLFSAGNPSKMADANNRIFNALLGLVVLLGSWVLLTTINPQLVVINPQYQPSSVNVPGVPGVFICKDATSSASTTDCQRLASSKGVLGVLDNRVGNVRFMNSDGQQYGIVLHKNANFTGRCAICLGGDCSAEIAKVGDVSSVTLFVQNNSSASPPGPGATFYECADFSTTPYGGYTVPFFNITVFRTECVVHAGPLNSGTHNLDKEGRSVRIDQDGRYLVALFQKADEDGECGIFTKSVSNLASYSIGVCGRTSNLGCFHSVRVLPILYPL